MSSPAEALPPSGKSVAQPESATDLQVDRWHAGTHEAASDRVAEETPVGFIYNGVPYSVMLATPQDFEDFAVGFSLSEGIVADAAEITAIQVRKHPAGVQLYMAIPPNRMEAVGKRTRNIAGRTGCGLCGTSSLEEAIRRPPPVGVGVRTTADALHRGLTAMRDLQSLNRQTGSVHAAAWANSRGEITTLREDVGRHCALDKLIGALMRSGSFDPGEGFLIVTSRASFEMVQKAGSIGITLLAAVSAPTALAVEMAGKCGMTLVGFAREDSHVVYSHPERLQ